MLSHSVILLNKCLQTLLIIVKMGPILGLFHLTCLATLLNLHLFQFCNAFNLETRLPVIKQGPRHSYFGYSVAEHLIIDENTKRTTEPVMLVGAPRGQSGQPNTNHSGVVFRCPLTTYRRDCQQLRVEQDNKPPDDGISKNDQWLGVTVKSQGPGGYVMVCAHRYILKGPDFQWGQGICYSLTQYLDFLRAWEPCYNRPVSKAHEEFGYCQAGTSGEITEDFDIVIGAPGPYTWRGTVFSNSVRYRIRDDKTWYLGPLLKPEPPVDKYSYLGMSVTSGKFFNSSTSYAGGAPRANGTGQVVFFTKHKGESTFDVGLILNGEQFASSYGYSMTNLDCNGDGLLDLVVGAPFYYSRSEGGAVYLYVNSDGKFKPSTRLTGKPESRFGFALANAGDLNKDGNHDLAIGAPYEENGVVYIHLGTKTGVKETPSQIIKASELPNEIQNIKTFGYSLSGTHDLDQNGYPDLLVGAYESDTVILFRSRPIINIVTSVTGELTQIDPNAEGCRVDPTSKLVCFSFDACFKFNTTLRSTSASFLKLHYRIEAETYTGKKYYRVKFGSAADTDSPNIVERDITLREANDLRNEHCSKETVYLKDKSDIQNPVMFKLTYSLIQKEPRMPTEGEITPDINKFPILNQEEAHRIFEARFLKECGSDEICESDLIVQAELSTRKKEGTNIYSLQLGEEHLNVGIKVINRGEPAYDANIYVTHPSSLSYVGRKIVNKGDQVDCIPQNRTTLKCDLGNPFNPGRVEFQLRFNPMGLSDAETSLQIQILTTTTSKDKSLEDDLVTLTSEVVRNAELELTGNSEEQQVRYGGEIKGEGAIKYEDEIGSRVFHKYIIRNLGPWRASKIDINISWPYQVENGREHGKWLLYLTGVPQVTGQGGKGYCLMGTNQVNPLEFEVNPESNSISDTQGKLPESRPTNKNRRKREMVILPREVKSSDGTIQNVVTMTCGSGARCFNFSCVILDLAANQTAVIRIASRLWNATLVEDYAYGVNYVVIKSNAEIRLDPTLNIQQNRHNDYYSVETKAIPDVTLLPPREVSWWWLIIAVLLGLILLALLILILWKVGFFKRKKPEYMRAETEDKDNINY